LYKTYAVVVETAELDLSTIFLAVDGIPANKAEAVVSSVPHQADE
jgi:hypothetical protein